jgi:hypothetical protein
MKADREERKTEMKAMQAKMDANRKEIKEDIKADIEKMATRLEDKVETNQARTNSTLEGLDAKINMHQEKKEARIHSMRAWRKEKMTCQETTEAHLEFKEPTSEDMQSEAYHREVPKEHAIVENGRGTGS